MAVQNWLSIRVGIRVGHQLGLWVLTVVSMGASITFAAGQKGEIDRYEVPRTTCTTHIIMPPLTITIPPPSPTPALPHPRTPTLYNRTSSTNQRALSSDHLPIITTINIRHGYRLQQNRLNFTSYKKADWTQSMEDTESAFAQTTVPTNIHTANIIFTNIILMADKHNIP